jgi:hypothetical protein
MPIYSVYFGKIRLRADKKRNAAILMVLLHLRPTTKLTLGLKPRMYTDKLSFAPIRDKLDETLPIINKPKHPK